MKTLPTNEVPSLWVLHTLELSGLAARVKHDGMSVTLTPLGESSDGRGELPLPSSASDSLVGGGWYKVVVMLSGFYHLSDDLVEKLASLSCPILFVMPVITQEVGDILATKSSELDIIFVQQSLLLNQVTSCLPSGTLLLLDGLICNKQPISSNAYFFQAKTVLAQKPPVLPEQVSLLTEDQALAQIMSRVLSPQVGLGALVESTSCSGEKLYHQIFKHLEIVYHHSTPPAKFAQKSQPNLPSLQSVVLPLDPQATSLFVQSTQSPDAYRQQITRLHKSLSASIESKKTSPTIVVDTNLLSETEPKTVDPTNVDDSVAASLSGRSANTKATQTSVDETLVANFNALEPTNVRKKDASGATNSPLELQEPQLDLSQSPAFAQVSTTSPPPLPANDQIDDQLADIFTKKRVIDKSEHLSNTSTIKSRIQSKSKRRRGLFVGGAVLTGISLAILFFVSSYTLSARVLAAEVERQLELMASAGSPKPNSLLSFTTTALDWQNRFYDHFFDDSVTKLPVETVGLAKLLSRLYLVGQNLSQTKQGVLSSLLVSENTDLLGLEKMIALQTVWADLSQEFATSLENSSQSVFDPTTFESTDNQKNRAIFAALSPHLAELLGFTSPQTYAIVFQNTQELRATGGFIQSLGLVTIENGQIISSKALSSYEVDKMLGGNVEAPADLTKQLGEKQLFFRDSNWEPDFANSAKTMVWFLEKSLNTEIDGVLAITNSSLKDILTVVEPLSLGESGDIITHQNLAERLESNSGIQGLTSNQPTEYSVQIINALLRGIPSLSPVQIEKLFISLGSGLNDANTLAYHKNPTIQQSVVDLGWSGSVLSPLCPSSFGQNSCRIDPFYINESNVGINKANQYIQRKNEAQIKIDESGLKYRFLLSYENQAGTSGWPKGAYKAYARVYLPPNASQMRVLIDGVEVDKKQVVVSNQAGRTVIGFNFEVPIKSSKQVAIEFETPPLNENSAYVFFMQKQPGVSLQQSRVVVRLPEGASATQVSPGAVIGDSEVVFSPTPNPHLLVGLSL